MALVFKNNNCFYLDFISHVSPSLIGTLRLQTISKFVWTCTWVLRRHVITCCLWFSVHFNAEIQPNGNANNEKKLFFFLKKMKTVRTLPRLLHVDRLSSLSHCRGPSGPPKRSLCRLHRQLRTGRLIIVTNLFIRSLACILAQRITLNV